MTENKDHWYDGLFYDKLIAPNQDRAYAVVKDLIEDNSTLLDAGCGTGRLAFNFDDKLKSYTGVDLSIKNIEVARKNLQKFDSQKIEFYHAELLAFIKKANRKFDYAVMSFVIHEINEESRIAILQALANTAEKVILIEYSAPRPKNFWSALNEVVEFVAGKEHYRNFKTFIAGGGIEGLALQSGLKIVDQVKNSPSSTHIAVLTK